jgi:RHS repeat-associated protein
VTSEAETVTSGASNGTITYGYDPLGQLTGSTLSGTTTTYGWDKVPNRTSVQVGAGTAATTAYDAADRTTSGSNPAAAYTSNADGMLTARPGQTLVWDHLGRLTQVKNAAGTLTLASYTYDPADRLRTAADGAGNRVRFRYTGMTTQAAQWWDDVAGTVTRSVGNDWSGERLLDWTATAGSQRYYGTNAHHDVTWLASSTGTVTSSLRYDPFGNARTAVPAGYTPFRFQGSWYDANSDLSWVVTRWYAPTLGRFVSEDSLLGQPAQPDSRHLYAYAAGEPVGRWDPDGQYWRRVRVGETLSSIAQKVFGSSAVGRLKDANPGRVTPRNLIRNPSVKAGDCIWIPFKNALRPWSCNPFPGKTYVNYSDALYAKFNGMVSSSTIACARIDETQQSASGATANRGLRGATPPTPRS